MQREGIAWHFHMIGPQCLFSQSKEQYQIIVEIEAGNEVISSVFTEKPISETAQMAELAYGHHFLKEVSPKNDNDPPQKESVHNAVFQQIMEKASACNASGTGWHNHHLHPDCLLNQQKGRHCIVFENENSGEALFAYFDKSPVDALSKLEQLFFAGK